MKRILSTQTSLTAHWHDKGADWRDEKNSKPLWCRLAPRSRSPVCCVPDRPYKILLVQVGTLSFSGPLFGASVLFLLPLLRQLPL